MELVSALEEGATRPCISECAIHGWRYYPSLLCLASIFGEQVPLIDPKHPRMMTV